MKYNNDITTNKKGSDEMSKITKLFKFVMTQLKRSIERFPITLIFSLCFMASVITRVHMSYDAIGTDTVEKWMMVFALGIPMSALAKVTMERFQFDGRYKYLTYGISILLPLLYYLTIPTSMGDYFIMRFLALWGILFLMFLTMPYFLHRKGLSRYVLHLAGKFFMTVLFAAVLYGGIAMMIFTIEVLFDFNWWDEIYFDLFIFIAATFGVTHFLGNVPEKNQAIELEEYSKLFKSLFLYIVLPIISVYTIILYAYFVKILFNFKLPEGVIGNLVLWYASVSVITLFFVRDLRSKLEWLERFFRVYIPLMTVPLIMLFVALFIRINAFGLTMPRYFVVTLAIFSTISVASMWQNKKETAVLMMILLISMTTLSFFGPLSGYQLTFNSQSNRLEAMLTQNEILNADGSLTPNPNASKEGQGEISNQINFLMRAYPDKKISALPDGFKADDAKEVLGFELLYYWGPGNTIDDYINYYVKTPQQVIDLMGSDYLVELSSYDQAFEYDLNASYHIKLENDKLELTRNSEVILSENLREAAAKFYLNQESVPQLIGTDGTIVHLIFQNIDGRKLTDQTPVEVIDLEINGFTVRMLIDLAE